MFIAVLAAAVMFFLLDKEIIKTIPVASTTGMVIQYIVIFDALISIPLGLYIFSRRCKQLRFVDDMDWRLSLYRRYDIWRIIVVGQPMTLAIIAYYLLGGYQSMLWVAAISAVGWYFCKPTARKIELEIMPYDDSY
jgi:hypothetical protein